MPTLPTRIRFRRTRPEAVIPSYAHPGDSGLDLTVIGWRYHHDAKDRFRTERLKLTLGERVVFHTGIAIQLPVGFELQIRPRSGLSLNEGLHVVFGTVDQSYTGPVSVTAIGMQDDPQEPIVIKMGTRIAQGCVCPVMRCVLEEVDEFEETERGENGFGSSGIEPIRGLDGLVFKY